MALLSFLKPKNELEVGGRAAGSLQESSEPEKTCPNCRRSTTVSQLRAKHMVCDCGHHFRMKARQRLAYLCDSGSFRELFAGLVGGDPLFFPNYQEKIDELRSLSREEEAVVCGRAKIGGEDCAIFVMEPAFLMGSMGCAVGEKISRLFEFALKERLPVLGVTVSGGARMQEGLLSLMQMAKTSAAVKRHSDAGLLYITLLTDPTTGGVTASFAMEGDVILAEPGATVGFAGARVIEQTTGKKLPKDFQTAEFVLEHGFIDAIVPRSQQKSMLARMLRLHKGGAVHGVDSLR